VLVCLGMTFATEVAVAQCPDRGTVVDDEVSNTQGKPYQAKEVRTVVTYGSDGTKREVVTKSNLFRDGRGRISVERFYDGSEDLGHKFIDGVEVRGERISYSSAQAKLSGASPVRIYENWCSISLDTRMGDYILDDKPKREITTVISDIKQIEPASSLFEIPEG